MKKILQYKNYIIIGAIILIGLFASILIINKINSDGMNNNGIFKVKYKVYQNNKWSKQSKNGRTSGNTKDPITDLSINIKNTKKGKLFYSVYTDSWSDQIYNNSKIEKEIKGIRIGLSDTLYNKYDVCYRTYNDKNKWLNWVCDYAISGNIDENITAIEIKIIPKKSVRFDYLKDFNKTIINNVGFGKE